MEFNTFQPTLLDVNTFIVANEKQIINKKSHFVGNFYWNCVDFPLLVDYNVLKIVKKDSPSKGLVVRWTRKGN